MPRKPLTAYDHLMADLRQRGNPDIPTQPVDHPAWCVEDRNGTHLGDPLTCATSDHGVVMVRRTQHGTGAERVALTAAGGTASTVHLTATLAQKVGAALTTAGRTVGDDATAHVQRLLDERHHHTTT